MKYEVKAASGSKKFRRDYTEEGPKTPKQADERRMAAALKAHGCCAVQGGPATFRSRNVTT